MSSHREFFEAQQSLNNLFQLGHMLTHDQREILLQELVVHARRMVDFNLIISRPQIPINTQIQYQPQIYRNTQMQNQPQIPRNTRTLGNPLEKTVIIAKKKLETVCPEMCAICHETPKFKDVIRTECNHYYCNVCWEEWMNTERSNKRCPTCRKELPRITSYKARVTKPKPRTIIIEDETVV